MMRLMRLLFLFFIFLMTVGVGLCADPQQHSIISFSAAKLLAKQIHADHQKTFYCGCRYNKHGHIDLNSCGYQPIKDPKRANRLEWEHLMPAHHFGQHRECWRKPLCQKKNGKSYKGRKCCQKVDPQFNQMEADLHNLVPEVGELNGLRSNFRYGLLPHIAPGQFGVCEFKIDEEQRVVEPRSEIRGLIARAYLYMANTYQIRLSNSQEQLFTAWNKQHPPTQWEIEWDNRIYAAQVNHNPYIQNYDRNAISSDAVPP